MRKKKSNRISLLLLLVAMLIIFSLPPLYELLIVKGYHEHGSYRYNLTENFDQDAMHVGMKDGVIIDDLNEIRFVDYSGNLLWKRSINSKNSVLTASDELAVIADNVSGDVFTIDASGNIKASLYGLGKIDSIKVFADKYIVVNLLSNQIVIFDQILNERGRVDTLDGDLLDYIIDTDNELLVFSSLWISESNFHTMITSSELTGEVIAGNIIDSRIGYRLLPNELGVCVVTENGLILYPFDGSEKVETVFDERVAQAYIQGKNVWFNLVIDNPKIDEQRAVNRIVKYNSEGQKIADLPVTVEGYSSMSCDDNNVYLWSNDKVNVLDYKGNIVQEIALDKNFECVNVYTKNYIGLTYNNHSKIMKLH